MSRRLLTVPFAEFAAVLLEIATSGPHKSRPDIAPLIGCSAKSIDAWDENGTAPKSALMAAKGVLAELTQPDNLSTEDLVALLTAAQAAERWDLVTRISRILEAP